MRKYSKFNIFENFKKIILNELVVLAASDVELENLEKVTCEAPKSSEHGDLATNVAMVFCKDFAMKPRDLAEKLVQKIEILSDVEKVEIAGPGFINVTMTNVFWQKHLSEILRDPQNFSTSEMGQGEKINLEFASANPTGPLHVGHARGAVFGDSLACLLAKTGYEVVKEYYVNDAGSQIKTLVESLKIRYEELIKGQHKEIPKGLYPGEYLIEIAEKLRSEFGDEFLQDANSEQILRDFALEQIMAMIKGNLKQLRIEHDVFTSEKVLHESGMVEKMIAELQKKGLTYLGQLEGPKAYEKNSDEDDSDQLIFKSTEFGDDSDRVIQKSNGEMTYFAGDLAYMVDKINRGFSRQVLILGADHLGYRKRLQAAIGALSEKKATIDVLFVQIVNFLQNGEIFKMSKRQGTYVTIADVVEIVGVDVLRFIMLTRKNDALLDFDLEKVKEQSKDNPVFYVQYALARACSVLEKAKELNVGAVEKNYANVDFSKLIHEKELELIKIIASYPRRLEMAAAMMEPHRIAFYLIDLAANFHGFWNFGKEDENLKFITQDEEVTKARLALVQAVINVFHFGLEILKVEPKSRM